MFPREQAAIRIKQAQSRQHSSARVQPPEAPAWAPRSSRVRPPTGGSSEARARSRTGSPPTKTTTWRRSPPGRRGCTRAAQAPRAKTAARASPTVPANTSGRWAVTRRRRLAVNVTAAPATHPRLQSAADEDARPHVESNRPLLPPASSSRSFPWASRLLVRGRRPRGDHRHPQRRRRPPSWSSSEPCPSMTRWPPLDYARRLQTQATRSPADLRIVMRVYFEKPRTTRGAGRA